MHPARRNLVLVSLILIAVASVGLGEWSNDPANNLVVADRSGEQAQPKIVATADGGFYISWFDNSAGGYDVYLQRLDAAGDEQWVHNGVLVADRAYSSTQDYGLSIDTVGNALLAFRDDRFGGRSDHGRQGRSRRDAAVGDRRCAGLLRGRLCGGAQGGRHHRRQRGGGVDQRC